MVVSFELKMYTSRECILTKMAKLTIAFMLIRTLLERLTSLLLLREMLVIRNLELFPIKPKLIQFVFLTLSIANSPISSCQVQDLIRLWLLRSVSTGVVLLPVS